MRRFLAAALGILAAIAAAPAAATSTPSAESRQLVAAILEITDSDAASLETELKAWEAGIRAAMEGNPAIRKIEADHPGAIEAGIAAGRPIAARHIPPILAKVKLRKGEILAERMTAGEIRQFHDFVVSPVGRRFYARLRASADFSAMAKQVHDRAAANSGKVDVTADDLRNATAGAVRRSNEEVSSEDALAIMKFERNAVARKIDSLAAEIATAAVEISKVPNPAWMSEQDQAVSAAIIAFAERKGR